MYYLIFLLALAAILFSLSDYGFKNNHTQQSTENTQDRVQQSAEKALRYSAYISGAEEHIKQRHWYKATNKSGTSYFAHAMTIEKLNDLANITLNKGDQRTGRNGKLIYQYHFTYPIGSTAAGKPAYGLRLVIDPRRSDEHCKYVITAFPVK